MKIIYDSDNNPETSKVHNEGSFRSQDIDITEDKFRKKAPAQKKEPHSGVQQAPESDQPVAAQSYPQQTAVPVQPYAAPVPMTQEQFNMMMAQFASMQNHNAQPVVLPNGQIVYGQYPQYPQYAPYPQPVQNIPQSQTVQTSQGEYNPGTRVLFQSEDFDKPEKEENKQVYNSPAPVFKKELDIDEETVELKSVRKTKSFSVDETQINISDIKERKKADAVAPQNENKDKKTDGKKLPTTEIVRRCVLAVSLVAIVIASGMLLNEHRLSEQNNDVMEEVSDLIITEPVKDENPDEEQTTERELTPEEQWAQLRKDYPNVIFPMNLQLKYAKLYAINQEFVGYLSADGVGLNLPVVQANDDKKYLEKNFYKQNTKYGCPFVTHLNNITPLDQNTVIFGHHMNNGTIFGALDKYKTIDGFKKAPLITFNTLYHDYSWKVIAAFVTNAYGKDDNGYIFPYYFTQLSTYSKFASYLSELSQRSLYDTGVDVLPTDRILTLSTCSHEFTDARFVVVARLVRPGESTNVDVSKATVNSKPRYPQAWYNKKNKTNPYKNAFQWEVG